MLPHIERTRLREKVLDLSSRYPVTTVLGARQTGKTSLVRELASSPDHFFDLERSIDAARLADNALGILGDLTGWVVLDEAQEMPGLFRTLRVLADRPERQARFIVAGSTAPTLLQGVSESLAGRAAVIEIGGFDLAEAGEESWRSLWLRGSYPPAFLAPTDSEAFEWVEYYLSLLIGRDIRNWSGTELTLAQSRKLLQILADSSGQSWNHSAAAKILEISYKTVQNYIEALKGAYVLRELPPFIPNVRKRFRKHPVLLFRDSGVLHNLLAIPSMSRLQAHPRYGGSWETFAIDQVIRLSETKSDYCYRYSVERGAEVDLVLDRPEGRIGFEFKTTGAPKRSESMVTALSDLDLAHLYVVFPGDQRFPMADKIEAVGIERLPQLGAELRS